MFGLPATVRGTARIFNGHLIEPFSQGDLAEGLGAIMRLIPQTRRGICKSLCMNWVAHHANDEPGRFSDVARSAGSGRMRVGGRLDGVAMALSQLDYADALRALPATAQKADVDLTKDQFTDDFLRQRGIVRQMNMKDPAHNLTPSGLKLGLGNTRTVNTWFGRQLANSIVGSHSARYWSYKIISIHGPVGGHAIAAFVGADAMFFDPNYGIFYFERSDDFRRWFGEPGGFYWESRYVHHLGDDFTIKSYAKKA